MGGAGDMARTAQCSVVSWGRYEALLGSPEGKSGPWSRPSASKVRCSQSSKVPPAGGGWALWRSHHSWRPRGGWSWCFLTTWQFSMKLHPRLHACTRSGQTLITNASNLEEDYREVRGSRSVMACYCSHVLLLFIVLPLVLLWMRNSRHENPGCLLATSSD